MENLKLEEYKKVILEKYIRSALESTRHRGYGRTIKVCCPFCNDRELKGTLWKTDTDRWWYSCWRASCEYVGGALATNWLKKVDPNLYNEYNNEIRAILKSQKGKEEKELSDHIDVIMKAVEERKRAEKIRLEEEEKKRAEIDRLQYHNFKRITEPGKIQEQAIEYCEKRRIPREIWEKFWYCEIGTYANRLIIPFYKKDGKISFFQARSLNPKAKVKYLCPNAKKEIYHIDQVDETRPIIVLEGPIDSIFVENSIATVGANSSAELDELLKSKNMDLWYLYDNDDAGRKFSLEQVAKGKKVFLWSRFLFDYNIYGKVKDVNDAVCYLKCDGFKFKDLESYFTANLEEYTKLEINTRSDSKLNKRNKKGSRRMGSKSSDDMKDSYYEIEREKPELES